MAETLVEIQEARVKDDYVTGITDPAERRRRQNRLHQRAWRRRKAQELATSTALVPACQKDAQVSADHADAYSSLKQLVLNHVTGRQRLSVSFDSPQSRDAFWAALETLGQSQSVYAYWAALREQRKREVTSAMLFQTPDFPLSVDHQIFVSIQHNTLRGVMANMATLLQLSGRPFEGWEDFYTNDLPLPETAPAALKPTILQKAVSHEVWIDVLPYPEMRDNIITHQDTIDVDGLCNDFVGGMYDGLSEVESRGLILWGEPWLEEGWEISEGFARKWTFLLKGCDNLVRSTNRWREARGEERLIVEV